MTRLAAETAGIMKGGAANVGSDGVTAAIRSCTSWRARTSLVPRLKMSSIAERSAIDFERSSSRPSIPLSCSSSGIVMSSSTCEEELPVASVWISTRGGANSGNTSTWALRICAAPAINSAIAANRTSQRNRRLEATIHRITPDELILRLRTRRCTPRARRS